MHSHFHRPALQASYSCFRRNDLPQEPALKVFRGPRPHKRAGSTRAKSDGASEPATCNSRSALQPSASPLSLPPSRLPSRLPSVRILLGELYLPCASSSSCVMRCSPAHALRAARRRGIRSARAAAAARARGRAQTETQVRRTRCVRPD